MPLGRNELNLVIKAQNQASRAVRQVSSVLKSVEKQVKDMDKTKATLEIRAEVAKAVQSIKHVDDLMDEVNKRQTRVHISTDAKQAEREVESLKDAVTMLDRMSGTAAMHLENAKFKIQQKEVEAALDRLNRRRVEATVDANINPLMRALRRADNALEDMDGRHIEMRAKFNSDEMVRGLKIMRTIVAIPAIISILGLLGTAMFQAAAGGVALASSAGQAIGVLAALPGLAAAGVGGLAALTGAFWGVQEAVKEVLKVEDEQMKVSVDLAKKDQSNAEAIREARLALADAYRQQARTAVMNARAISDAIDQVQQAESDYKDVVLENAKRIAQARQEVANAVRNASQVEAEGLENIHDAQRALEDSHFDLRQSYAGLHDARQQALLDLYNLNEAVEDNVLSEEGAEIALARARERLIELNQSTSASELDLREARLAVATAEDRLGDTRHQGGLDAQALQDAEKKGVEGSKAVVDAKRQIADAEEAARDATLDLARVQNESARNNLAAARAIMQAEKDMVQTQRDASKRRQEALKAIADAEQNLQRIRQDAAWAAEDAARRVAEAQKELQNAMGKSSSATDENTAAEDRLAIAMGKLTPEGRRFVRFLTSSFIPRLEQAGQSAQRKFLPPFQRGLQRISSVYFPMLNRNMGETGGLLGRLAERGANLVTTGPWRRDVQSVLDNNLYLLQQGGEAGFHFADAFRNMSVAALPLTRHVADFTLALAENVDQFFAAKRESGALARFYDRAWKSFKQLWRMAVDLGNALWNIAEIARPAGQELMKYFEDLIQRFRDFTENPEGKAYLKEVFESAVPFVKEVFELLIDVTKGLADLGIAGGPEKITREIRKELLPALLDFLHVLTTDFASDIIDLLTSVTRLFTKISEGGSGLQAFLQTFEAMADAVNALLDIPGVGRFVHYLLIIAGIGAAFGLTVGVFGRFIRAFEGLVSWIGPTRNFNKALRGTAMDAENAARKSGRFGTIVRNVGIETKKATRNQGGFISFVRGTGREAGTATGRVGRLNDKMKKFGSTRWGRAGLIGGAALAIGGVAAAAGGTSKAMDALSGAAMGAMTGMIFGPWGAAVGGAAGALWGLFKPQKELNEEAQAYVTTLNKQTGAFTRNTKKLVAQKLAQGEAFDTARTLGISMGDVTDVVLRGGSAYDDMIRKLEGVVDAGTNVTNHDGLIIQSTSDKAKAAKDLIEVLKGERGAVRAGVEAGKKDLRHRKQVNGVMGQSKRATKQSANSFDDLADSTKTADRRMNAFNDTFETTLDNFLDTDEAALDVKDALADLRKALKDSKGSMDDNTQSGRDARRQFHDTARAVKDQAQQVFEQTGNIKKAKKVLQEHLPQLEKYAGNNKHAKETVERLRTWVDKLKTSIQNVPTKHETEMKVKAEAAKKEANRYRDFINDVMGGVTDEDVNINVNPKTGKAINQVAKSLKSVFGNNLHVLFGGQVKAERELRAGGGEIRGPGTGTSDSITARIKGTNRLVGISNGEFVQRAAAVEREGVDRMHMLNEGRATIMPLFAAGGSVGLKLDSPRGDSRSIIRDMAQKVAGARSGIANVVGRGIGKALGEAILQYAGGGFQLKGRQGAYGGVKPWVAAVGDLVNKRFGPLTIGGVGARGGPSDHPSGHALDFMTYNNTQQGDRIAGFLSRYHRPLALSYEIWKQRIMNPPDMSWRRMADRGSVTANHFDHVHASFLRSPSQSFGTRVGGGGNLGEQALGADGRGPWRDEVSTALRIMSQPQKLVSTVMRRLMQESGGNAGIVNKWDSNWAAGIPSVGLMQVIGPTYRSYKHPRYDRGPYKYGTSINPVANILASMRYALARYGSLGSAYNRPGGYAGGGLIRDRGGLLPRGVSTVVNNTGASENLSVLNRSHMKGLNVLSGFASGGAVGSAIPRMPRVNIVQQLDNIVRQIAGVRDARKILQGKDIKRIGEWIKETYIKALTGSPAQVKNSKAQLKSQIDAYQKEVVQGLKSGSRALVNQRERLRRRLQNVDEVYGKRSTDLEQRRAEIRDRLEKKMPKGRRENLQQELNRINGRLKVVKKEEGKQIKAARARINERIGDIGRQLVRVREREAKEIAATEKRFAKAVPRLRKQTEQEYKVLAKYSEQLKAVGKKLASAQGVLQARQAQMGEFAAGVRENTAQFADILTMAPTDGNFLFTAEYVELQMKGKLEQIQRFNDQLNQLRDAGLSDELYKKLAEGGVEGAGDMVEALSQATPEAIARLNEMQDQLDAAGQQLGEDTSQTLYQAGVNAALALVEGLEAEEAALQKAAQRLAEKLAAEIRRALGINSPSRVGLSIGHNFAGSIAVAIEQEERAIKRAAEHLAGTMSPSLGPVVGAGTGDPVAGSPKRPIIVEQKIYTQELDPVKHAADLGYEFAKRIGDI